jgi:hypothetical protein
MTKAELIADLNREYGQWEALLAEIGDGRMEQPGVAGSWSVKDLVAHLTGWNRRTVGRFEAALRDEADAPPPWPAQLQSDDAINAWIYEQNRDRSLPEVLGDSRQTFVDLVAALEAFPEAELLDPARFPWLEGEALSGAALFGHFRDEHESDLRAWLARQEPRSA